MVLHILNRDVPLRNFLLVVGEGLLIFVAVMLSAFLHLRGPQGSFISLEFFARAFLIMFVCQISLYFNDLYDLKITDTYLELGIRLTKAIGITSIILGTIYFFFPSLLLGRGICLISIVFTFTLIVFWRYVYDFTTKKMMLPEKILGLGSGDLSEKILNEINGNRISGYQLAGLVTTNSDRLCTLPPHIPIFSLNDNKICDFAVSGNIRKIIVAMGDKRGKLPIKELLHCKMQGITVLEGESFYEKLTGKILAENINPSWLIYSEGFRKSRLILLRKRAGDIILAGLGLILSFPLTLLAAVAIKLESKGPVIYQQERCGQNGHTFKICKFRSMIDDAESQCGPVWALEDDCRVTRVGKILRKLRLDEIPQMWNVLKGDMSFIGPRPERPEFVEELEKIVPYYLERHTVKPGITGWAQVSYGYGASVEDALEKLKYDLFYIKNMSTLLDFIIVFRTAKIVLQTSGSR